MTPEFARAMDDRIAYVLGRRVFEAIRAHDWDAAIHAIELLDPVIARLGSGTRETEFNRYLVRLAQELPSEHPREREFVQRASLLIDPRALAPSAGTDDEQGIPVGQMTPQPLPSGGAFVGEDAAADDLKTILAVLPDFSSAISSVRRSVIVTDVPYFHGWHLIEVMPRLAEANDLPVASRAFFVNGERIAPITGNSGVFLAIAQDSGLDVSTVDLAKDYVRMHIACSIAAPTGMAGRVVEPGDVLPFCDGIDEETKASVRGKLEVFELHLGDDGKYEASGNIIWNGSLHRFELEGSADGKISFQKMEAALPAPTNGQQPVAPLFYDSLFTKSGWRILRSISVPEQAVSSEGGAATKLPTTLPGADEGEQGAHRPCVVSPPGATSFAGLPLRAPEHAEMSRIADIPGLFPPGTLDSFDLEEARVASLPFLPTHAVALVPHRETGVSVPFVIGGERPMLVGRTNEWLYALMEQSGIEHNESRVVSYARFFFSVIVGQIGNFKIVESDGELPWTEAATDDDRKRAEGIVTPIHYLGRSTEGVTLLFMCVVFKNALFRTNCRVAKNWQAELRNEELILEDQPFIQGAAYNLTVSR
jgi:hypothetical protein